MTRAYGGLSVAQGTGTTDGRRPRGARGRPNWPNWWVILAVSLALMALLVATSGTPRRAPGSAHELPNSRSGDALGARGTHTPARSPSATTSQSTTTTTAVAPHTDATALASTTHSATVPPTTQAPAAAPSTTTTTVPLPPPTTTTTTAASPPLGASSHQGVIEPPAQRSSSVGFTGSGATEVSVVWSGSTYLTMQVSCPDGSQSVGGSSAMAASLPDASGSCLATVSEPASESTALTYTITIGPPGG